MFDPNEAISTLGAASQAEKLELLRQLSPSDFRSLLLSKAQALSARGELSRSALYLDAVLKLDMPNPPDISAEGAASQSSAFAAPHSALKVWVHYSEEERLRRAEAPQTTKEQQQTESSFDLRKVADVLTAERPIVRPSLARAEEHEMVETSDRHEVLSETLGDILFKQAKYSEARKVFMHLARIHPERIEEFKKKIAEIDASSEAS